MNATELRDMSEEQLRLTLGETEQTLFKLRMQAQTERLDAPTELRRQRRLIARIKTVQAERAKVENDKAESAKTERAKAAVAASAT